MSGPARAFSRKVDGRNGRALAGHALPGLVNGERLFVGVAMDQLKPAGHRGLDHRLAGHRRLEDDHPGRLSPVQN